MAQEADLDALLATQRALNQVTVAENTECDDTYYYEYKRYVKWVKSQPALATNAVPFLTRRNIDHYFTRVVAKRAGIRNTASRIVNSLKWYAKMREHPNADPPFDVMSRHVNAALLAQIAYNKTVGGTGRPGSDPHLGLKDILSDEDRLRMMRYIYGERRDWGPASISFTWGMNGAIRGASNRVFTYADLNLSFGFGPEPFGPLARALLLILRSGPLHKDRQDTSHQVCCWRHIEYQLCSVFATAMQVIWKLSENDTLHFLHADKTKRADWWDIPLIDWEAYGGEYWEV